MNSPGEQTRHYSAAFELALFLPGRIAAIVPYWPAALQSNHLDLLWHDPIWIAADSEQKHGTEPIVTACYISLNILQWSHAAQAHRVSLATGTQISWQGEAHRHEAKAEGGSGRLFCLAAAHLELQNCSLPFIHAGLGWGYQKGNEVCQNCVSV